MNHNFWINIYKPRGVNSTKVTNLLKKLFKPSKVGHAGTLDPLAEGLLPIAVGEATKTIEFFHNVTKTYEFEVIFGKKSSSGDLEGEIIKKTRNLPTEQNLKTVLPDFIGKIKQTPPKYSAIKIDGKRAYDLARAGKDFEIKQREVDIHSLDILNVKSNDNGSLENAVFRAEVSLGTYIRSLAEDIAEASNSLGVVGILKRIDYGCFSLDNSFDVSDFIKTNDKDLQMLKKSIIQHASFVDVVLDNIPVLHLNLDLICRLRQGQRLNLTNLDLEADKGFYRVYDSGKKLSLIAKQDEVLRPYKVFNL